MSISAKRYLEKTRGKLTLGSAIRSIRLCEDSLNHYHIRMVVEVKAA